jgi:hypothetical protein
LQRPSRFEIEDRCALAAREESNALKNARFLGRKLCRIRHYFLANRTMPCFQAMNDGRHCNMKLLRFGIGFTKAGLTTAQFVPG